jgi:hypothetical protein
LAREAGANADGRADFHQKPGGAGHTRLNFAKAKVVTSALRTPVMIPTVATEK